MIRCTAATAAKRGMSTTLSHQSAQRPQYFPSSASRGDVMRRLIPGMESSERVRLLLQLTWSSVLKRSIGSVK